MICNIHRYTIIYLYKKNPTKCENLQNLEENMDPKLNFYRYKTFITFLHRFVFLPENGRLSEVNIFKGIMNSDCLGRTSWL